MSLVKLVNGRQKNPLRRLSMGALGVAAALAVWELAARAVGSSLILPSPGQVLGQFGGLLRAAPFWRAVSGSLVRVFAAFLLCLAAGALSGAAAGMRPWTKDFFAPLLTTIRATPVLALILVAMFWLPSGGVPIFSAFLMAFPVIHTSVYMGIRAADPELLEMASVFKVPPAVQFFRLRLPAARGHLLSGAKNALGLCWKVVVAGEVLSQPRFALGTGMQDARLSLETPSVFAWAAATVLLCGISEFALGLAARRFDAAGSGSGAQE